MSRLVNYGVGEIVDRLTILELKILHGRQAGKAVDHFETERAALLTQLRGRSLNGAWFEHVLTLGAVNGLLWRTEDTIRAARTTSGDLQREAFEIVTTAFRIQALNDQRAALIETINKLTGEHLGSEKG